MFMFIRPLCNSLKHFLEPRFPRVATWIFGAQGKARKVIILSQEDYNKHVEENFQRKLKEIADAALKKEATATTSKKLPSK